ncbi:hypothetical protein A0128_04615 [Leptospira tipperaryensis]|uniref:Uncharacterized protein n=1 Tax=Leptospira tipperaryensis TaxID=2564040 RepID=A0A1D7V246_9LEPT|nr:hypothetical protein [Leptospira tipperaryensis]AOP35905.1 hypothetical protein A0128_04615 [Leptospira tipperaryensis]
MYKILILLPLLLFCSKQSIYNPSVLMSQAWYESTFLDCILKDCLSCKLKVTNNPVVSLFAGTGAGASVDGHISKASFLGPVGIEVDLIGNIYVSDQTANLIRKIDSSGNVTTLNSTGFTLVNPSGIKFDSLNGDKYVTCKGNGQIYKIDSSEQFSLYAGSPVGTSGIQNGDRSTSLFDGPFFMDFDREHNLYVGELTNHDVRKINLNFGNVSTLSGGTLGYLDGNVSTAQFKSPIGIAYDRNDDILLVADIQDHRIRQVDFKNQIVSTLMGTGTGASVDGIGLGASFNGPVYISLDNGGYMFISDSGSNVIRIVDPSFKVTTISHTFGAIGVVKVDCLNQRLLVADSTANQIFQVKFQ